MLKSRLLVTIVLLPIGMYVIWLGGWWFTLTIALLVGLAAKEYVELFRAGGLQPAAWLVPLGAVLLVLGRGYNKFESAGLLLSLLVLTSMTHHLVAYERGRDQAATDFNLSLGGMLYLGWVGAYLVSLRDLPDGMWWFLLALPSVWLADAGAYLVGSKWGKHLLCPRLSPKKTWEGYLAGLVTGTLGGILFGALWGISAGPVMTPWRGALLGLILSLLTPLGDLGESMIKRQVHIKDSSNLLPGHGGMFDRIDSWLWGGVLGYYIILFLWL